MTNLQLTLELINNPLVQIGGGALLTLALALLGNAIATQPKAHDVAQDVADLSEDIEPWVVMAEKSLLNGDDKYSQVFDKAHAWLKERGITGQRGRVIKKYLPMIIEAAVKKVDPKNGDKKAA